MGLFRKRKRTSRAARKAEVKAIARKAELEAKAGARRADRIAKKSDRREAKASKKVNKARLDTLAAQKKAAERKGLTAANVTRYLGVARVLVPVALPLLYRGATALRSELDKRRANQLGVSVEQVGEFQGPGARLRARIAKLSGAFDDFAAGHPGPEGATYAEQGKTRLEQLGTAVDAAELMAPARRRTAVKSIDGELDALNAELLKRLGVN